MQSKCTRQFWCTRGSREDGAVLVELALILPVLFALLLGITSGGQAYAAKISVTESVREGARFGASLQLGQGTGALGTYEAAVRSRVVSASNGSLAPEHVCVALVLPQGSSECGVADPAGASSEPQIHIVKVSASKPMTLGFFFFTTNTNVTAKLGARYERDNG